MEYVKFYYYGMRLRPYGIGCQPKGALCINVPTTYHNIIAYDRELTEQEEKDYDLDYLDALSCDKKIAEQLLAKEMWKARQEMIKMEKGGY